MLYSILKRVIKIFLKAFFRSFDVLGEENIPAKGPVIYVANHPSAVIDPIAIAVSLKDKLYFLAGEEYFGKGLQARIFKKEFNMIPVARPWLKKDKKVSNIDMFQKCFESLAEGKSILLFPEASSVTVSKIRELKTGAIRIKLGFEKMMDQTVPIVPIGLNFSNAHEFQSRLLVKIGEPIQFKPENNSTEPAEVYREKSKEIQQAMSECIVNIENDANEGIVKRINRLFINIFLSANNVSPGDRIANFKFAQSVANAVTYFESADHEKIEPVKNRINHYFDKLKDLGVSNDFIENNGNSSFSLFKIIGFTLGLLLHSLGVIYYFLPYQLSEFIYKKVKQPKLKTDNREGIEYENQFTGTMMFGMGVFIYILWTLISSITIGYMFTNWSLALMVFILAYPMLRFNLYFARLVYRAWYTIKSVIVRFNNKSDWKSLVQERTELIDTLKEYQSRYDSINQ